MIGNNQPKGMFTWFTCDFTMVFVGDISIVNGIYPRVICYIAIENGPLIGEPSHEQWWIFP